MDNTGPPEIVPQAPSYHDLRRRVLVFALLFAIFVVFVSALGIAQLRASAIEAARARAQSYSNILSAHLDRTMGAIDARLEQIALQSERLGGPSGNAGQWQRVLDTARAGATTIGSLSVTGANGRIRHSTLRSIVGADRADRFISQALANPDAPDLLSDEPIRSVISGELLLPFGRRLIDGNGRVTGAVVATFAPESLRDFYRSIDTEGGVLRVLHRTGAVVFAEPAAAAQPLPDDPVLASYRAGYPRGAFIRPLREGGPTLITSYAAVGDTALIVAVSLGQAQALQAWRQEVLVGGLMLVGLLVAFGFAVALMLRQLQARELAEAALAQQRQRTADAQRLESLGQLTGGVAHDFNNLLTVIIGSADSLVARVSAELRPRVAAILYAADNAATLIQQLLAFSRRQALKFAPVDLNVVLTAMEDMLRRSLGARVETEFALAPGLWRAYADRAQIESALLNLAINARDAMPDGGKLTIETNNAHLDDHYAAQNTDVTAGDYVVLAVTDTGIGMAPEVVERAMEPFFTTKDVGRGSGLGLSMIYGFARQSKGHVKIYSEPGRGTTVRLYLPRDASGAAAGPPPDTAVTEQGSDVILIVEDDAEVRRLAATSLRERGYHVLEAPNGPEAVAILDSESQIDLLLTDVVMPGKMTGKDVAEHALASRPEIKVLFTSGYADASVMRDGLVSSGARFLSKPYRGGQLAATIRALLDA
ncbi:MAG: ATP-binding protein [Hyphomonadaceae bacterium]